jgi:adenine-specific DNA-methyltransferase
LKRATRQETASLKFILGILNSTLINHLYATKFLNVALKAEYLKDTPIPAAPPETQKVMERLVDRILTSKQQDAEADVSALERQIDQLVYGLYGLTPEEIQIVEGTGDRIPIPSHPTGITPGAHPTPRGG